MAKSKLKISKDKAWKAFSEYIRTRDAIHTTGALDYAICCTCGKAYPAFGLGCGQAGHFIPGRRLSILFDDRNCHFQCYNCNVRLKGNPLKYYRFMQEKYGESVINELEALNDKTIQLKEHDYKELAEKFKRLTDELRGWL